MKPKMLEEKVLHNVGIFQTLCCQQSAQFPTNRFQNMNSEHINLLKLFRVRDRVRAKMYALFCIIHNNNNSEKEEIQKH